MSHQQTESDVSIDEIPVDLDLVHRSEFTRGRRDWSTVGDGTGAGGRLKSIRTSTDGLTVTVVVSGETDVRQFVEQLGERYANVTLIARRDGARPTVNETRRSGRHWRSNSPKTVRSPSDGVLSGFCDWPRETTGRTSRR
ncbi:hypothetical protein C9J85_08700 [Haloferax sp. wsp5]|nr:hypothetical protein C9J85_08700 [Haloferax sp. wsp5]